MTRVLTNSTSFTQLSQRNVCYNIHQHQLSDYSNSNFKFKCSFLLSLRYIHRWFSFNTARRSPVRPIKRLKYASQLVEIKWSPQKLCDRGTTIPARVLVFSLRIANSRPSSEAINRRRGNAVHLIHSFGAQFYLLALHAFSRWVQRPRLHVSLARNVFTVSFLISREGFFVCPFFDQAYLIVS